MAQNKLSDLNDFLMSQIQVLSDEELKGDELIAEIKRGKAIASLSSQVIKNAKVVLDASRFASEGKIKIDTLPKTFEVKEKNGQKT